MSQIAAGGGQPQKQPKYAPIYTGRFYNGLNTNRSPLRAASADHHSEKYYSDSSGDALIAGSNLEVTNRLTLARRPGNPIYDTMHMTGYGYNNPDAFSDFRVNKAASDVFGTTLESIYTMIDETTTASYRGFLYSLTSALVRGGDPGYFEGLAFQKAAGAGRTFTQPVGNTLYFSDGVDNKKWLTSLFVRTAAGDNQNLQGADGLAGTYPFGTYLIDPATGNPQELIGITIGSVTNVAIASNVLTLTMNLTTNLTDYLVGTSFQLWGMTSNPFLDGATITLTQAYTHGFSTTFVASFNHADMSASESGPSYIIQAGTTPIIAVTGGSVPTWGTVVPVAANDFRGSLTLDGNTVWANRGTPSTGGASVENWGIKPPTTAPTFTSAGQETAWVPNTMFSPASVFLDANGNLWQVTTAGKTGTTIPIWNPTPTPRQTVIITSVSITGNLGTFVTDVQSPALVAGDKILILSMAVAGFLVGQTLTVLAGGLTTTGFTATTATATYAIATDFGTGVKISGTGAPTTTTDGTVVWTSIATTTSWSAHKHYNVGDFIIQTVGGVKQLFQLGPATVPFASTTPSMEYIVEPFSFEAGHAQGAFEFFKSTDPNIYTTPPLPTSGFSWQGQSPATVALNSLNITRVGAGLTAYMANGVNGAGELSGATANLGIPNTTASGDSGPCDWVGVITCKVFIPVAGTYTFTLLHDDGAFFSFDTSTGATKYSGTATNVPQTMTAKMGYGSAASMTGTNTSGSSSDSASWHFPAAGEYGLEIDYAKWRHADGNMQFLCPGPTVAQNLPIGQSISGATTPVFPTFTTFGAHFDPNTNSIVWGASVKDNLTSKVYTWNNLGLVSDFIWQALTNFTLPGTTIIDPNANQQGALVTGVSGTVPPSGGFSTAANTGLTADNNPPLTFLNEGAVPAISNAGNTITATSAQGWLYWIALVNTLDQTVSNLSPVSLQTGPLVKGQITFAPGAGLDINAIDPQADYVAIFRSADGFTTPLLIPGFVNSPYTVPLPQYLLNGYVDTVPDVMLNNLVQGPLGLQNTPPVAGTSNLTYHLNRIWYSVGNTVKWSSGPLAPIGNGDGTAPGNFAACPSQVRRLVPTAIGMIVLTQSDVYIIAGNGTAGSPILPAIPYLIGVGLGSYNALDINGGLIGFFTTDKQFVIFDPSAGLNYVGFNIGDQFRLNNGIPGQSWDTSKAYVAWYVNGEDVGWYISDGVNGWYRMIYTPAPEQGSVSWSPFATIQGTCGAIASIETSPGVHRLLIGQTTPNGNILNRDLDATTDNGATVTTAAAAPEVNQLGSADNFGILASSTVVGSAGAGSTVAGDLGLFPGTSVTNFPPSVVSGVMHVTDATASQAQTDLTAAILYYTGLTPTLSNLSDLSTGGNGATNATYNAGVYVSAPASSLDIPTTITLDAQGNSHAIFVFVAGSTITLESGANVVLANGAQAGNVYWVCGSSFTSIWNGIQSDMVGTIMAAVSVTLGGGTLHGRALASTAAVTLATTETFTFPTLATVPGTVVDTGTPYLAYGVLGSIVLANPGQIAKISHITTVCVRTGSPLLMGVILNEALPYYTGSFDILKRSVSDPPGLPESKSFYRQRFYLDQNENTSAYCMDLQVLVQFPAEAAHNELQTLTIFGAYEVEQ